MSNSTKLAKCDMVLAVSEDTINYQFNELWKRNLIKKHWKLLVREETGKPPVIKTSEDADFETVLSTWQAAQEDLATLFTEKQYAAFGQKLGEYQSKGALYNYGWDGTISAPGITILQKSTQILLFKLNFSSGTLYYSSSPLQEMETFDLKDTVYAFKVPVGRVEITDKEKILTPEAQGQAAKVIRDSGLTDADFLMESLFMDFENADIANFDEVDSHFPKGAAKPLQITIEDYFKRVVAKEENPYILGYGMSVKKIDSHKALFQPTKVRYTTSFSEKKGCSVFNFVMMSGGSGFPSGQEVGILPVSLLENVTDLSQTDGVFAIDYSIFQASLLDPFIEAIQEQITKGFGTQSFTPNAQQWSLSTSSSVTENTDSPASDLFKDTHVVSNMTLSSSASFTNGSSALLLQCNIDYNLNIKVQPWALLHGGYYTVAEAWLSTSGTYGDRPDQHKGQQGYVHMSFKPGTNGQMEIHIDTTQKPYLGYDKETYNSYTGGSGEWAVVEGIWNSEAGQDTERASIKAAQQLSPVLDNIKNSLNDKIASFNNQKVILPLGEIYTFKNIQLFTTENIQDNPVLFNVKYATKTN